MPTPVGHVLAGLAVAWSVSRLLSNHPGVGRRSLESPHRDAQTTAWPPLVLAGGLMAIAPDLDILVTVHRAAWHSLSAAAIVGLSVWALATARGWPFGAQTALVCGLAWASHVLLDWLGRDQSPPQGVMALWPVSRTYLESGLDLFAEVSRRYWKPDEFIWGNLRAVGRELIILVPVAAAAWLFGRRPRRSRTTG